MPDNQIPAAQPESGATPNELNFDTPQAENPRIKRRSLKAKPAGLIKPTASAVSGARDLEREAPPLSAQSNVKPQTAAPVQAKSVPVVVKAAEVPMAPPRTTPSTSTASSQSGTTAAKPASSTTPTSTTSPHGTRPATLYYSSPRKDKEAPTPMKTTPSASTGSTASASSAASATTQPSSSATRPAATAQPSAAARTTTAAPTRPSPNIDYRANVDRQSREQKSVGSILAYVVYGLIAFFVITAVLAGYGADVIFKQLHDQSATVADLDKHYAAATADLNTKLAAAQDALNQTQSQISRQQDVIIKQQEELNHLITSLNDDANSLKIEKQTRTQETTSLRARVKDLESRNTLFNH